MEASAPSHLQPEPAAWQPRALWVSARLGCGAVTFFFLAFLFAYFYLRTLDPHHGWKIGTVDPSVGFGIAVTLAFVLSAAVLALGARDEAATVSRGGAAIGLGLVGVVLQFVEFTTLGFGAASGAYASVFIGWTSTYALAALAGIYWIETQVATAWRLGKEGTVPSEREHQVMRAGIEACSFFWSYFVALGVLAFVVLYVV